MSPAKKPASPTRKTPEIGTLFVLGASGDLTKRLLLPGLGTVLDNDRGQPVTVVGCGREPITDAAWTARVREAFASVGATGAAVRTVIENARYQVADVTDPEQLADLLAQADGTPAIYFALPPAITEKVCEALAKSGVPEGTVLVLEKPFGSSRAAAVRLNKTLAGFVEESQIFRVDHFNGRGDVLNLLGIRFANRMLEPIWNNQHIEKIEIFYDEDLALEGRAGYYDKAGALVDMIQSHLLQVMAIMMMEPIPALNEVEFREAKAAVLRSTRLWSTGAKSSRRARYTAGKIGRRQVPAYSTEEGVDPSLGTETLAEITVEVRTWRWRGVPVTLRSGKALGTPRKEAVVTLKKVPHLPEGLDGKETADEIRIGFKPPSLDFLLDVTVAGDTRELDQVLLEHDFESSDLTAYGEVLAGVFDADPMLSVRGDSAEESWRIVEPVLRAWRADSVKLETYPAGSEGPSGWSRPLV